jgi:hypothetical protein
LVELQTENCQTLPPQEITLDPWDHWEEHQIDDDTMLVPTHSRVMLENNLGAELDLAGVKRGYRSASVGEGVVGFTDIDPIE